MTDRLIPLEEAAQMLGMLASELTNARAQNEIFGYRDGAGWKFKMAELERFADERGVELTPVSEQLSTDSDLIALEGDSGIDIGSEATLKEGSSDVLSGGSDKDIEPGLGLDDGSLGLADSDIDRDTAGDTDKSLKGASSDIDLGSEELIIESGSSDIHSGVGASDSSKGPGDTGKMLDLDQEELLLAEDDLFVEEELRLEEDSDEISLGPDSEISSDYEDSDLVIESEAENEIVLDAGDSGLTLSPTDSGIALDEEPLELGGSDIDSLELPEDDEVITLEEPSFEEAGADDDFMLTPVETLPEDDDSSGSQVIALEDSEIYDSEDAAGSVVGIDQDILGQDSGITGLEDAFEAEAEPAPMAADPGMVSEPAMLGDPAMAGDPYAQPGMMPAMGEPIRPTLVEAPYSIWNVLGLMCVVGFMGAGGMLAFDFYQHVHYFDEPSELTQNVMNFVIGFVEPFQSKG